ncbi:MAG: MoxR family ATPase [Lachnospiraceae bacterium]|nr:MoxR family ATPase [Lachnospiraceae bacterium]
MEVIEIAEKAKRIKDNISKVIIGKEEITEKLLTALFAGGHVILEDVPGTGKTRIAKSLAASLDLDFNRIQFTPDLLPADVTGLNIYNQKIAEFQFTKGPVFTNILLADEINRATPRTQSGLLECMQEGQVTVDGETRILDAPFFIIATQNPVETAGTYPLPEAQLDRFAMQLAMGYPTQAEEVDIINRYINDDPLVDLQPVCTGEDVLNIQDSIKEIHVSDSVKEYIALVIGETRRHPSLILGANPRGTLFLLRCAQSYAAIHGKQFVTPDDIKDLAPDVLSHRLLSYTTGDSDQVRGIIREILDKTPVPTEVF